MITTDDTRTMAPAEHKAWSIVLLLRGVPGASQQLARLADDWERRSLRAEERGCHAMATNTQRVAELFDYAQVSV